MSYLCKNLYNSVLYVYRQIFFRNREAYRKDESAKMEKYPSWITLVNSFVKDKNEAYYNIGNTKISQMIVKYASNDWFTYMKARDAYFKNPSKFLGQPKPPYFKDKENGRSMIVLNNQTISSKHLKMGDIKATFMSRVVPFKFFKDGNSGYVVEVRIVPKENYYVFSIIYRRQIEIVSNPDSNGCFNTASMDLGLDILCAIANTNGNGILVNGKPLKYINQKYNKLIANAKSLLPKGRRSSNFIKSLWLNRDNKINDYMHKQSTKIINTLHEQNVDHLIIGKNDGWKQDINIGKRNNQNFVSIPYERLIFMLKYKAAMKGIKVTITEEAYTSKASCMDKDQLFTFGSKPSNFKFSGNRKYRGLYISKSGIHMNADMNGAVNIMRKVTQVENDNSYSTWVSGCVVSPKYI